MVINRQLDDEMRFTMEILKLENSIKELKWYQFIARNKMNRLLSEARYNASIIGMQMAIKDLVKAGVLQEGIVEPFNK